MSNIFLKNNISEIYNFAAQAGVRYSMENPGAYINSNVLGFANLINLGRENNVKKFFYASSSSVYGDSNKFPLKEKLNLKPKNLYGLTKKHNEEMAAIYYDNFNFKTIGLRFFTVFGEWGRPDMFLYKLLASKFNNKKFVLNNNGNHFRDFTFISGLGLTKFIIDNSQELDGSGIYDETDTIAVDDLLYLKFGIKKYF